MPLTPLICPISRLWCMIAHDVTRTPHQTEISQMEIKIEIDPNATFVLKGGAALTKEEQETLARLLAKVRHARLDAYELSLLYGRVWEAKHKKNDDGTPFVNAKEEKQLDHSVIITETTDYVEKLLPGINLNRAEALGIFNSAIEAWEKVQKNWQSPIATSPTSSPSLDLMSLE